MKCVSLPDGEATGVCRPAARLAISACAAKQCVAPLCGASFNGMSQPLMARNRGRGGESSAPLGIFSYIERENPKAAVHVDKEIAQAVRRLLDFPESGRVRILRVPGVQM